MAEIYIHGSIVLVSQLIAFLSQNGTKIASRGEFSKRAYLNGKMDLTAAEGIKNLIESKTKSQLRAAQFLFEGGIKNEIEKQQTKIKKAAALYSAAIDYPEEGLEEDIKIKSLPILKEIETEMEKLLQSYENGKKIKNGVRVGIVGKTNAGKSSLFNALVGFERAIVDEEEGTTRDTIEQSTIINDIEFTFVDTAGFRKADQNAEIKGIERTKEETKKCDILLLVAENEQDFSLLCEFAENENVIYIKSKDDLQTSDIENANNKRENKENESSEIENNKKQERQKENQNENTKNLTKSKEIIFISTKTGKNIENLKELLLQKSFNVKNDDIIITELRHFEAINSSTQTIKQIIKNIDELETELVCIDLMEAFNKIGEITGSKGNEEIISEIFSSFCVGK
jgi:tRNA modification GTPase